MGKRFASGFKQAASTFKQAVKRITAWSYSRWNDYEKCPAYAKFKFIDKIKEPESNAMENGTIVHQMADHFVRGTMKKFPKELGAFKDEYTALRDAKALTEQEWAFNDQWEPVDWFAKDAWVRVKVDATCLVQEKAKRGMVRTTVVIIDTKTGKNKAEHAQQRTLYALGGFSKFPDAVRVVAEHWYIDSGEIENDEFTRADIPKLKQQWEKRTRAMLADTTFVPRPGAYCRWCAYSKAKSGPCQF